MLTDLRGEPQDSLLELGEGRHRYGGVGLSSQERARNGEARQGGNGEKLHL